MRSRKRFIVGLTFLIAMAWLVAACGQATTTAGPAGPEETEAPTVPAAPVHPGEEDEIVIYNWAEYLDPELYSVFMEETGIDVTEDTFTSNEELLAKLQGLGETESYALIFPSDYMVRIMIAEGLLARLDHNNIPNLANLDPAFQNTPADPGNEYCVPYMWGTTGIGYNSAEVDEPTSWAAIFEVTPDDPAYGRITMLDDPRESFAAALTYLGYNINTTNEAELEEAKQLLIRAKAGLSGYDSDTFDELVASGENLMAHGWNGDFLVSQEENEDLLYTVPKEGGVIWVDYMCIPATASPGKKAAAENFINFLLRPDISAANSEYTYFASPNGAAKEFMSEEFLNDPVVYPPEETTSRLQFIEDVGEFEAVYERMWEEVKSAP